MSRSSLRSPAARPGTAQLPFVLLGTLTVGILAVAGLLLGFTEQRPVKMPDSIWHPVAESQITLTKSVLLAADTEGGVVWIAAQDRASLQVDGADLVSTQAARIGAESRVPKLAKGLHTVTIKAERSGGDGVVAAMLDLGSSGRLVTDASWGALAPGGTERMAQVVSAYGVGPLGTAFGDLPREISVPKGAGFWIPLIGLLLAMVVACLAGPTLRPSDRSRPDTRIVDLAIIRPSVIYASAAFSIVGIGASAGASPFVTAALLVAATVIFVLALVAWKQGSSLVEEDQRAHLAEISGYDAMQTQFELVRVATQSLSPDFQSAIAKQLDELSQAVRFAATTTAALDVDSQILDALRALEGAMASDDGFTAARFTSDARSVVGLIRRREVLAQAGRRG